MFSAETSIPGTYLSNFTLSVRLSLVFNSDHVVGLAIYLESFLLIVPIRMHRTFQKGRGDVYSVYELSSR